MKKITLTFFLLLFCLLINAQVKTKAKNDNINETAELKADVFSIYPNPSVNKFNIDIPTLDNDGTLIEVFNVLGKKIWSQKLSKLSTKVDIASWNSGLYLVRIIIANDDVVYAKRFVKL